jgi:hypothetical protein
MLLLGSSDAQEIAHRSSRAGEYEASVSVSGEAKRWPEVNLWRAVVRDRTGRTMYQIAKEVPFDFPFPSIVISDSGGSAVLLDAFEGWVEFYNESGSLLRRWEVYGEGGPNYERSIKCSVAGDRVAFLLSGREGRAATVHMTDMMGNSLMNVTLDQNQAGELHISDDGSIIVAGCYAAGEVSSFSTSCFRSDGTLLRRLPILFRTARVSPDRKSLLLADRRDLIEVGLESQDVRTLWSGERRDQLITDVCYAGPSRALLMERVVLSEGLPRYAERDVLLLDADGNLRTRRKIEGSSEAPGSLTFDGERLTVTTGPRIVRMPLVE